MGRKSSDRPQRLWLDRGSAGDDRERGYHSALVSGGFLDGLQDICRLRQDGFFELGIVGDRRVERGDAPHRRVEMREQLAGDSRRELGAEAARQLIFVGDDDAVGARRPPRRWSASRTA